jgi:hypothetical protein
MKRVLECRHDEPPLRQKQGGEWDELICCVLLPAATAVARYAIIGATREYSLLSVSLFLISPFFLFRCPYSSSRTKENSYCIEIIV